jgi:uncharacterized oligopeptide transporter (OPT) family protein
MKKSVLDNFFHNHFKTILLGLKIILIPITIVYFVIAIILSSKEDNTESVRNWKIKFQIFNNILFYIIIGLILFTSIVLLYVTRQSSMNIFHDSIQLLRSKKRKVKATVSIPTEYLSYYLSVIWWMLLYLFVVTIFVTIAKIKHDPNLIYNLF